jgi:hypothetical protein
MLSRLVLLTSFLAYSVFAQIWAVPGGGATDAANVTYMAAGEMAKATTVRDVLRESFHVNQYMSVQDAINAASGKTLYFTPGDYSCENLTWGTSMDILVVVENGSNLLNCELPAVDARHWILDWRAGNFDARKINGVEIKENLYLLRTDASGAIREFTFPPNLYLTKTDANGHIASTAFPASLTIVGTDGSGHIAESTHLSDYDHDLIPTAEQTANKDQPNGYQGLDAAGRMQTLDPIADPDVATMGWSINMMNTLAVKSYLPQVTPRTQASLTAGADVTFIDYTGSGQLGSITCFARDTTANHVAGTEFQITVDGQSPVVIPLTANNGDGVENLLQTTSPFNTGVLVGYGTSWLHFPPQHFNLTFKTSLMVKLHNSDSVVRTNAPYCSITWGKEIVAE